MSMYEDKFKPGNLLYSGEYKQLVIVNANGLVVFLGESDSSNRDKELFIDEVATTFSLEDDLEHSDKNLEDRFSNGWIECCEVIGTIPDLLELLNKEYNND